MTCVCHIVRRGFTIVELLVVIAVIGVLVGLMLPALQSTRAAARQAQCSNNLRQIGVALQAYHQSHDRFPPGGIEWRPAGSKTERQLAWSAFLLPFLEQRNIYERLNLALPFDHPENARGAAFIIETYVCPSSSRGTRRVDGRGPIDYGGIYGERIRGPNQPPKGAMIYDRGIADAEIRDGLSNTLIVAEDSAWPDGQWINGRNLFDQAFAINAAPPFENDIRSQHVGGANTLLAGGAVRFLTDDTNLFVLAALCTRAGGEPLGSF